MASIYLFPEEVITGGGSGPEIDLGESKGTQLQLSLSITRMVERQTLDISIWGSSDGSDWGLRPLLVLARRYYCGTYHQFLDLSESPKIRYLRIDYQLHNWAHSASRPMASFCLTAEAVHENALALAAY